jgi:hypothetical protein
VFESPLIEEFGKQENIKEKDDNEIQLNTLASNYANLAQNYDKIQ